MTTYESIRRAQESLRFAPGAQELGHLLWWTLNGTRIQHNELTAAAERHGLAVKLLPTEIKPVQAFRRAWRHATSKLSEGLMLRPIAETEHEIVVGLVREKPNEARRDLDYDVIARIAFDRSRVKISADVEHGVVEQIRYLYRHHLAHTTEDIRTMMTSFLSEAGVSLRDSGGVYFVPAAHSGQLEALCRVVEEVGHNRTFRLPIIDTLATRTTLREVTERSLDHEVRELEEELAGFDFEKVRDSTLERRLEMFEQLRNRAALFAGLLSFKADGLNQRIAAMSVQLRRHLAIEDVAETPAPPAITEQMDGAITPFASDVGF
jgi:hypothetical protein